MEHRFGERTLEPQSEESLGELSTPATDSTALEELRREHRDELRETALDPERISLILRSNLEEGSVETVALSERHRISSGISGSIFLTTSLVEEQARLLIEDCRELGEGTLTIEDRFGNTLKASLLNLSHEQQRRRAVALVPSLVDSPAEGYLYVVALDAGEPLIYESREIRADFSLVPGLEELGPSFPVVEVEPVEADIEYGSSRFYFFDGATPVTDEFSAEFSPVISRIAEDNYRLQTLFGLGDDHTNHLIITNGISQSASSDNIQTGPGHSVIRLTDDVLREVPFSELSEADAADTLENSSPIDPYVAQTTIRHELLHTFDVALSADQPLLGSEWQDLVTRLVQRDGYDFLEEISEEHFLGSRGGHPHSNEHEAFASFTNTLIDEAWGVRIRLQSPSFHRDYATMLNAFEETLRASSQIPYDAPIFNLISERQQELALLRSGVESD